MRGFGFFEALAGLTESDPRWRGLSAGLLTLCMAADTDASGVVDKHALGFARDEVRRVSHLPLARSIRSVLDAIERPARDRAERRIAVAPLLLAYGVGLHSDGLYTAALDVYEIVATFSISDGDLYTQAIYRRAFALRLLNRYDEAQLTYEHLESAARQFGVSAMRLEAQLGMAKLAMDRGNMPAAAPLIDAVIRKARAANAPSILQKALLDRARLAGVCGDPASVLAYSRDALVGMTDGARRERVLVTMAHAFRDLGLPQSARDIAESVAVQATQADQRAFARLLLYHLAIDATDWCRARIQRDHLCAISLSPLVSAELFEAQARESAARGRFDDAERYLDRLLAVAEEHRLTELIVRGDRGLVDVRRGVVPALYQFQPNFQNHRETAHIVARIERAIPTLCTA